METTNSQSWQRRAEGILPGGVNSPVRSFRAVGGGARWMARGEGAWLVDVDGNRYVDFICSWGALLLGHAPEAVVSAVAEAAAGGMSFGASTPAEVELGEAVRRAMPGVERVRFVNSGTEATMAAARLARGFTRRTKVVKFAGGYHGHGDLFLAEAGSGLATLGVASSEGVPAGAVADTITVRYNDLGAVEAALAQHGGEVAAVMVEPVAGNMGCVPPAAGFLEGLRRATQAAGALLILDEVMTGFRVAAGGATARYGVTADLITLGKIIGGGMPVGAYGGRADIMAMVAPLGPVYQAGTLAGNPVAMAAGLATLRELGPELYARLERRGAWLEGEIAAGARAAGIAVRVQRVASMLTVFFCAGGVGDFEEARRCDTRAFARFHGALLEAGVMWPPSQFEAAFFTAAHGEREMELVGRGVRRALQAVG